MLKLFWIERCGYCGHCCETVCTLLNQRESQRDDGGSCIFLALLGTWLCLDNYSSHLKLHFTQLLGFSCVFSCKLFIS